MKIAYFDCFSGASGDMINGALLDAGLSLEDMRAELARLPLEGYHLHAEKTMRCHIASTRFDVQEQHHHDPHPVHQDKTEAEEDKHHHPHRHLADLNEIVESSSLQETIKNDAKRIFLKIGEAEAKVHGVPVEEIHFHEIGAVDTIIDVVGALVGLRLLGIDKVVCSPLNVGSGTVTFSHGTFPVPAPATIEILKGIPVYATDSQAELVTPTGAAILAVVSSHFGDMPALQVEAVGYGAGFRDLSRPNLLRLTVGRSSVHPEEDEVLVLETCLDDQSPQLTSYLAERLLQQGALDVYLTPIVMKKGRPAVQCTTLCRPEDREKILALLFRESSTIGVRVRTEKRRILSREVRMRQTPYGPIPVKISSAQGEILQQQPEYEAMRRIAEEKGVPLKKLYEEVCRLG